jgi:hypothetical protein
VRAALVVHRVLPDRKANLRTVLDGVARAASAGADLAPRIVNGEAYQTLWLDRCARMHRALAEQRR